MNWTRLKGIIQQGHQVASGKGKDTPYPQGTIPMQSPFFKERGLDLFFKERGLDLSDFYFATLNISIAPHTFTMIKPEYTFRQVHWTDLHPPEDFSFSRCRVIFENRIHPGIIYYPHPETKERHFQDPSIIEIIAPFIEGIQYLQTIEIEINAQEITLQ